MLAQLKGGVRSLTAPLDSLLSNWAYMVMASLAWSLKAWTALALPEDGRWAEKHRAEKSKLLLMGIQPFRHAIIEHSNSDHPHGPKDRLPLIGMESLATSSDC